jgi:hypothetical protein
MEFSFDGLRLKIRLECSSLDRGTLGLFADCGAIVGPSGLNLISPGSLGSPLLVSCDQETFPGGWALVQRRMDGSEDFNRKWSEYATGFGSPSGEYRGSPSGEYRGSPSGAYSDADGACRHSCSHSLATPERPLPLSQKHTQFNPLKHTGNYMYHTL